MSGAWLLPANWSSSTSFTLAQSTAAECRDKSAKPKQATAVTFGSRFRVLITRRAGRKKLKNE